MICPTCGRENAQGSFDCEGCGRDLSFGDNIAAPSVTVPRHILRDPIRMLAQLKPLVARPEASIADAIRIMREGRHGSVLIVDRADGDRLVGIFTERDVLLRVWGSGLDITTTPVSMVMTPEPVTLPEEAPLSQAIDLMAVRGFRHIPIVRSGSPVGFLSVRGILRHVTEQVLTDE
jgi:CBS domain-containing protein